ncbi:hypothetical protein [Phytoactinopolyspora limicola]|uniref:hypothetical protein n=1 Tax=Phytoactinopolyspora limicola TaxID=2715536 RepID=UPI00140E8584|nr:hypothetical protein [Phytoactinopolyspora limicola]
MSFDLVVCSHLLFTWADVLDEEWHLAALREMVRVARREVRVFPLVGQGTGDDVPFLAALMSRLGVDGYTTDVRTVPYVFQRGAAEMLVVGRG